jgi:hypothetical protein
VTRRVEEFNGSRDVEDDDPWIVALAVNESRFLAHGCTIAARVGTFNVAASRGGMAVGVPAGYASYTMLDAGTPRSIPLIARGF